MTEYRDYASDSVVKSGDTPGGENLWAILDVGHILSSRFAN